MVISSKQKSILFLNSFFLIIFVFFLSFCNSSGKNNRFTGNYKIESNGVTVTLSLNQKSGGFVEGKLSSTKGAVFNLEGIVKGEAVEGECKGDNIKLFFEARIKDNKLILNLIEPGKDNKPDYNKTKILAFERVVNMQKKEFANNFSKGKKRNIIEKKSKIGETANLSNEVVTDPNWGYKITVPKGWKYKKNGNILMLGHNRIAGIIFVFPHMLNNISRVRNNLRQGISNKSMRLSLATSIVSKGNNILSGDYTGIANNSRVKARGYGTLSPYGGGAFIIAITTPEKFSQEITDAALILTKGIKYFKTNNSNIMQHFAGRWKTNTKNTETVTILYPDGRFIMQYSSSYSGQQGSWGVANGENNSGRWSVRGNKRQGVLILTYSNGEQENINYQVHIERGRTYWSEYYFGGNLYWKE